jgi:hypothetical protein
VIEDSAMEDHLEEDEEAIQETSDSEEAIDDIEDYSEDECDE